MKCVKVAPEFKGSRELFRVHNPAREQESQVMEKTNMKGNRSLLEVLHDHPFEVNDWGSCQYSEALHTFGVFKEQVKSDGLAKTLIQWDAELGLSTELCTPDGDTLRETLEEFKVDMREDIRERTDWSAWLKYTGDIDEQVKARVIADLVMYRDSTEELEKVQTATDMFNFLRNQSWDLWGAAPFVGSIFGVKVTANPGVGDRDNIIAGIVCGLLVTFKLIENEDVFGGFDT